MLNSVIERWHIALMALIVVVKNWLLEAIPFVARSNFPHDDTLFVKQAADIVAGKWLGAYDHFILIKGPIYPLWIAANHFIGFSIIHSQDFLFLAASLIVTRAIMIDVKNKFAILVIFSVVYLNPVSFDFASISHAFRMVIYTSLSLMVFGALLGVLLRVRRPGNRVYGWSTLFGLSLSLFWYTREEGMWVVPGILFTFLAVLVVSIYQKHWSVVARSVIAFIVIPISLWSATTGVLSYMNWKYYNAPYVVEVMTPNFTRAYNALLRIEPVEFRRYFPVRSDTIERVMKLSGKAGELTEFKGLEDRPAAHFIWTFRQGVAHAGYYDKGADAVDQYYSDLADELEALCDNKTLKCNDLLMSDVPPWQPIYTEEFLSVWVKQIKEIIQFKFFSMSQRDWYSWGDNNFIKAIERLTHSRIQIRKDEVSYPDGAFFWDLHKFKNSVLENLGQAQLAVRPALFYLATIILIGLFIKNVWFRQYNPYTIFGLTVLGSILVLCAGITIIEVTAYNSLFRPRHGALPLPPLFIVSVIMALVFDYTQRKKQQYAAE